MGFENLIKLISPKVLSDEQKKEIIGKFNGLVDDYLVRKELETIVQAGAYPWHNNTSYILDNNGICIGSRGINLGCTFGHPDIFLKLKNPQADMESLITGNYESRKRNIEIQFSMPRDSLHFDFGLLHKAFYVGAICGNADLMTDYMDLLKPGEPIKLLKAIKMQFGTLAGYDDRAKEISETLSKGEVLRDILEIYHGRLFSRVKKNPEE